eukprot:CAMPEP_0177440502 /NCGR_PEP_ID=MMETSP0369-20130122/3895_1 /TAXON_ID=447022 ORGANISM="Scrippsiella hangoei-like, Strain SHHI-4" /NCGR_SAMPLE_ID=MMETSP0369 /ASSEMBLY_ACC=CAM_ASM_000364 /LENGTH=47 /DNA_ID= /DNA_START= /DNA_END= /DNA_ORIENTATION=
MRAADLSKSPACESEASGAKGDEAQEAVGQGPWKLRLTSKNCTKKVL